MHKSVRALACFLFAVLLAPEALFAEKSLFWRRMDVAARLDAQGVLHVAERQAIVFTGDWNGGERKFRIQPGQRLRFTGISRQDEAGQMQPLAQGNLSDVDHYAFTDPTTLRWRSRLASDPPFEKTEILYELDYELSGILLKEGGTYVLDHDFAFPDRSGRIEAFALDLTLDPAWKARAPMPSRLERGQLAPGAGVVVRMELEHTGGAKPSAVRHGTSRAEQLGLFLLFLGAVVVLAGAFYRREAGLGRFAPLPPGETIDAAWLERKIFTLRPEEVGALWDETIGAPEVAAVLARLAAEKKIVSSAEGKKLKMRLSVPLSSLEGYEKNLLEALFFNGRQETDTDAIRAHYRSSGFDPASKIKPDLEKRLSVHADFGDRSPRPRRWPTLVLLFPGLALMALATVFGGADGGAIVGAVIVYGILWGIATVPAYFWQKRMHNFLLPALGFLWLPAVLLYFSYRGMASLAQTAPLFLVGLLMFKLAIVNNLFNVARTRNGPHRIARRKTLVAAREFFKRELEEPRPRLEDGWFPYIVAFGLSSGVERWFRAYGGEQAAVASRAAGTSLSGGSSSPSGGWTGGGGSFGGAGASASWATAAGALAAGVSAPS
ncbi:MAG TPA: hypothetical protein VK416_02425, partial [Thermoanaerobaculia bacterium]|nr:hypothetical protein [Thermoanaerobaculia bacterium]